MTESIEGQLIKSLAVGRYEDKFTDSRGQIHTGEFVMQLSLVSVDVLPDSVEPEFAVVLTDGQLDKIVEALESVTSVNLIRNKVAGGVVEVEVVNTLDGNVVVISDPGPPRKRGTGLIAVLSVVRQP
jgi:hypothetical protein